jgi:hypothetical protein
VLLALRPMSRVSPPGVGRAARIHNRDATSSYHDPVGPLVFTALLVRPTLSTARHLSRCN